MESVRRSQLVVGWLVANGRYMEVDEVVWIYLCQGARRMKVKVKQGGLVL